MRRSASAFALLILVSGCSSPARPTASVTPVTATPASPAVVNPLTGIWIGTAQAVTCSGYYCSPWVPYPLPPKAFSISVIEQGGRWTAFLDIEVWVHIDVEMTGAAQADGSIIFSGSARPPQVTQTGTSDMHRFQIRLNPATGLAGDFAYTLLWPIGSTDVTGRIVSATRPLVSPVQGCDGWTTGRGCFDGPWQGGFLVKTIERCEGGYEGGCGAKVGSDERLNLTLSQNGDLLSGSALARSSVPISGRMTWASALLEGRIIPKPCGYPGFDVSVACSETIENLSVSLDQYGRMVGTLRYTREGWSGSSSGSTYYAMAVTGELWNVVRTQ